MSNLKLAKRYSKALFEVSKNSKKILDELTVIKKAIFDDEKSKEFFLCPIYKYQEKEDILKNALNKKIDKLTYNFILTLVKENRFEIFDLIVDNFKSLIEKENNLKKVQLISAVEIENTQQNKIIQKLKKKLNLDIILENKIDETIIGGFILRFDDTIIDLSLKKEFEDLKHA